MDTKHILIVYQHDDFIGKALSKLFPTHFTSNTNFNPQVNIIITEGQKTVRVYTQLGLNKSCGHPADEIYIEGSLLHDDNRDYLLNYGVEEEHIHIINSRGL